MATESTVTQIIIIFSEEFEKFKMTDHRRNIWMMMTDGIPDDALLAAAYKIVAENDTWPPTIGMLRTTALAIATGIPNPPTGLEAWEKVMEEMGRMDENRTRLGPRTQRALKIFGVVLSLKYLDNPSDRSRFIEAFDTIIRREKEEREMLPLVRDFISATLAEKEKQHTPELSESTENLEIVGDED